MAASVIECVPNFSEGRDVTTIRDLERSASSVSGAQVLDRSSDIDHNRTVLTIAGEQGSVIEAIFRAVRCSVERIHLPKHEGVHPRIGVADVVPFVPIVGVTLAECADAARAIASRIWAELGVPTYLYEAAAANPSRARLEVIRSGAFRGEPDFGIGRHPTAGATIVGARGFLVAWNINLESRDLDAARKIARSVRESSGGLPCVKAMAFELRSRGQVQVSINLTNFEITPLHVVFERVQDEAAQRGIAVAGSELIGLIPQRALVLSAGHDLRWLVGDRIEEFVLESRLN